MKKNQKYTKSIMYPVIEKWKGTGLSQTRFCEQEGIARKTFRYWLDKYNHEKKNEISLSRSFIPIQMFTANEIEHCPGGLENIIIVYPNGIKVSCPSSISVLQLKTLINP